MFRTSKYRCVFASLVALTPFFAGCPISDDNSDCGHVLTGSDTSNEAGKLTVVLANGPQDDYSLLVRVNGQIYVGLEDGTTDDGDKRITFENLPSGRNQDVTWEISGCEDEVVTINGPDTVDVN